MRHCSHSVSSSPQHLTWSLAMFKGKRWWHQIHSPSTMASMLFAKRFWQKATTDCRHIWHAMLSSTLMVRKLFTQNPQKLCPQGVAISASNKGFLLKKLGKQRSWMSLAKLLIEKWCHIILGLTKRRINIVVECLRQNVRDQRFALRESYSFFVLQLLLNNVCEIQWIGGDDFTLYSVYMVFCNNWLDHLTRKRHFFLSRNKSPASKGYCDATSRREVIQNALGLWCML